MVEVMPWLLEREYRQHRNLDYSGLPKSFAVWRETASMAGYHARVRRQRVVKVIIHPGELEEWARQTGQAVSARARTDFAQLLWLAEIGRVTAA